MTRHFHVDEASVVHKEETAKKEGTWLTLPQRTLALCIFDPCLRSFTCYNKITFFTVNKKKWEMSWPCRKATLSSHPECGPWGARSNKSNINAQHFLSQLVLNLLPLSKLHLLEKRRMSEQCVQSPYPWGPTGVKCWKVSKVKFLENKKWFRRAERSRRNGKVRDTVPVPCHTHRSKEWDFIRTPPEGHTGTFEAEIHLHYCIVFLFTTLSP